MPIYSYRQYMRKYRVIVQSKSTGVAFDVSDLRCKFSVEKATSGTPNNAQIMVFNVSDDSASVVQDGDKVYVEAGYVNGNYGLIFSGEIVQAFVEKGDDVDSALVIMAQDGDKFLTKSIIAATVGAGASGKDIVAKCMESADGVITGQISDSLSDTKLPRGKVLFGRPAEFIDKVAQSNQAQFFVEDGVLNIAASSDFNPNEAVELTPYTGLVGTPTQTDKGIQAKCLINASLKLNGLVHIDRAYINAKAITSGKSKPKEISADGIYKVIKLKYDGDTRGDDWYCDFEAIEVAGKTVAGLVGNETNSWR